MKDSGKGTQPSGGKAPGLSNPGNMGRPMCGPSSSETGVNADSGLARQRYRPSGMSQRPHRQGTPPE